MPPILRSQSGLTFFAVLFIVVISGIILAAAGQSWQTVMKGDREQELLFRGDQYRRAIEQWRKANPKLGIPANRPLTKLEDLLKDPNALQKTRYLRKLYKDPITGKDFVPVRETTGGVAGISGVASSSEEEPLKQDDFAMEYLDFAGKKKYTEWKFVYRPPTTVPGQQQPNAVPLPSGITISQGGAGGAGIVSGSSVKPGTTQEMRPVQTRPSLW